MSSNGLGRSGLSPRSASPFIRRLTQHQKRSMARVMKGAFRGPPFWFQRAKVTNSTASVCHPAATGHKRRPMTTESFQPARRHYRSVVRAARQPRSCDGGPTRSMFRRNEGLGDSVVTRMPFSSRPARAQRPRCRVAALVPLAGPELAADNPLKASVQIPS
jgi:hypothetical protein